jgi:putative transposase
MVGRHHVHPDAGRLALAAILDLYSRRIVGWAMSDRIDGELTQAALRMALEQRQPRPGLLHHSDQGRQYTDHVYQTLLQDCGFQVSMNGVGTWYDNAPMESFFGTLKSELIYRCAYRTRNEARTSVFSYIEAFYNRQRRHSALNYLSPEAYEQLYYQQLELGLTSCPQN